MILNRRLNQLSKWYAQQLEPRLFRKRRRSRLESFHVSEDVAQLEVASLELSGDSLSPLIARYQRYYQQFFHQLSINAPWQDTAGIALLLPLSRFPTPASVDSQFKKQSANFWRESEKANKAGFIVQPFMAANHTPDLLAIRRSRKVRSFGLVLDAFTLRLSDLGGAPTQWQPWAPPAEAAYWDLYFGVFRDMQGHQQGALIIDQQLVAYVRVHRIGNSLRYAELMGHAQFQSQGVMNLLHRRVLSLLAERQEAWQQGIDYLSYGALEQGAEGLCFWKRKALFQPMLLCIAALNDT